MDAKCERHAAMLGPVTRTGVMVAKDDNNSTQLQREFAA